jgi:diguanylate cyclase (GGDEF)-like protein
MVRSGTTRRHALPLWLSAGAIVGLAVVVAISITALRGHADGARQVQLIASHIRGDAQQVSRIEWQATAEGRLSRPLGVERRRLDRHIRGDVSDYERAGPADALQLRTRTATYLDAVEQELSLLDRGRVAASAAIHQSEVGPSFERLQSRLELIDVAQSRKADKAATASDLGVIASLLLAALILIVVLSRLDRIRGAAARQRHEDLEVHALHDALTGLPNRRQLLPDLEQAMGRAAAGEDYVLLLSDLDGFKSYNDTFGHLEGDLLLGRVGDTLSRVVAAHGTAYRLGGDEFCALLRVAETELDPVLAACHAALRERGSGFDIRASIGCVVLPGEASNASSALRLADQRMDAQKNARGTSVNQQLRDLILRVLAVHDGDLDAHVRDVAQLAAAVGRRLGLDGGEAADLVRAAELHDVGKIAIPDSILHKPGPLAPDEQQFMRRHTLIGENILSAASALAGVGRLVRSSHERYDGTGYPDRLQHEEIPLASRIIFVCDAYDAMTTDRPYRKAMSEEHAIAELRRCASTQFDPAVVDAFITELGAVKAASRAVAGVGS